MKKLLLSLAVVSLVFAAITVGLNKGTLTVSAEKAEQVKAPSAYLIDFETGSVLYEKNKHDKRPIASMVKIMTAAIAFDAIDEGRIGMDEEIQISANAAGMGGSQLFLDAGANYKVKDLMKGILVVSANDASVAIAEALCGSEEEFVALMNRKAKEYGMNNTQFSNATGLPKEGQYSTAEDVSIMTRKLLSHKIYYDFAGIWIEDFTHPSGRITQLVNTNKLIRFYEGCDSGKTGFTNDAMFCLSASAKRNGLRVVATVLGGETSKQRFADVSSLFNYAFATYESKVIFEKDKLIENTVRVEKGKTNEIELTVLENVNILKKKTEKDGEYVINLPQSVQAPIKKGDIVGEIVVKTEHGTSKYSIVCARDVEKAGFFDSINKIAKQW